MPLSEALTGFSSLSLILLIAGLILLVIEMFLPDFGIVGGLGIALLVIDVIVSARSFVHGLILGGMLALFLILLFLLFLWIGATGKLPKKLVLSSELNRQEGFVSADFDRFLGAKGVAASPLRPAGIMKTDGENLDVVSDGEFIEKGSALRIKRIDGNRLVVELDE